MAGIYNYGFWHSLALPQNGYYQTISRVTYGIALGFGLLNAPLVANIIAILIRCFFVSFILSRRMNFIEFKYRLVIAAYIILMPNVAEGFVNITNAHWYLSMYLMAVVMAKDAGTTSEKLHDFSVLIISGLSGPFVVFIAPCLIIKRVYTRGGLTEAIRGINMFDICMVCCCIIQVTAIMVTSESTRPNAPLGYSFGLLANIVSCRIIYGSFLPFEIAKNIATNSSINLVVFVVLCVFLTVAFIKFGWRIKSLVLFPVLMIGFALARPVVALDQPQWPIIFNTEGVERYFYVTNVAIACLVISLTSIVPKHKSAILSAIVIALVLPLSMGYRLPALPESGYAQDVKAFETKNTGDIGSIRILPPGWTMSLIKK
jgi:hypothetical protein